MRDTVQQLESQLRRGAFFTHTALSRNAERIHEVESFAYGLVDLLVEKGVATTDEISNAAKAVRQEMDESGETVGPGVALRVDGVEPGQDPYVPVNCAERIHICKAICCRLHFALSAEEVESGKTMWDLGQPYYIRQGSTGCCVHLDRSTNECGIYKNRPVICRAYSCATDDRIWKDFDKMELNEEWINQHMGGNQPRLVAALMWPYGSPGSGEESEPTAGEEPDRLAEDEQSETAQCLSRRSEIPAPESGTLELT